MDRFESATLVVIGSGPGIGVSTASLFAARKFHRIALISRNQARLEEDRSKVCQAAAAAGRTVEVRTWSQDVTKTVSFKETLREVAEMGNVSCIIYNAARVGPSNFVTFKEEELLSDFATANVGLFTTIRWAIPILRKVDNPTILVTSSSLAQDPIPSLFSASMAKASQKNMIQSCQQEYPNIHIAQLNIVGPVSNDNVSPAAVALKFWELYSQDEDHWTEKMEISGNEAMWTCTVY